MSDSIIAVFSMGWLLGVIATLFFMGMNHAMDKGQFEFDGDVRIYFPSRNRMDRSNTVCDSKVEGEQK